MQCPMCRVEYTMELVIDKFMGKVKQKDATMQRILGKINMLFCADDKAGPKLMTHYVTNVNTFNLFKPVFDIHDDNGELVTLHKRL